MPTYRETNRTVETHTENLIRAFVFDANGIPVPNLPVKVWAGDPPFWVADAPFRTNAAGLMEFIAVSGPMPQDRDYYIQLLDLQTQQPASNPSRFLFRQGQAI